MQYLRDVPDWVAGVVGFAAVMSTILGFVVGIMLVAHFTSGPHDPQNCNGSGVERIYKGGSNSNYDIAVVCNNGHIYRH